jgi:hypothetical protein
LFLQAGRLQKVCGAPQLGSAPVSAERWTATV